MSLKNPLTPAGIEPANFRFVAQHLNHCATAVPPIAVVNNNNNNKFPHVNFAEIRSVVAALIYAGKRAPRRILIWK